MSLPHAHLVFVTKNRHRVFTEAMLTYCENTMRAVCADLGAELVEFNGEADHLKPGWAHRLKYKACTQESGHPWTSANNAP